MPANLITWSNWIPRRRVARLVWPEALATGLLAWQGHYLFATVCALLTLSHARTLLWVWHSIAIVRVTTTQNEAREWAMCRKLGISEADVAAMDKDLEAKVDAETRETYNEDRLWVWTGRV